MLPLAARFDVTDRAMSYAILARELRHYSARLRGYTAANIPHCVIGQLVVALRLASGGIYSMAATGEHVGRVLLSRADVKVSRVEAGRVVAVVENKQRRLQIEAEPEPRRCSMHKDQPAHWKERGLTVAFSVARLRPHPAVTFKSSVVKQP